MESKSYAALDLETLAALDPNTSYAKIREMVGSGKRVLDVGCGPGNLATILSRMGNTVVGIDKDDAALASAKRVCERTIAADLDAAELGELVGDERFDVVIFADVLEHLRNPVKLLDSSRRVLRDAGNVIVSIPNVAHGAVRLALLRGRFDYQQLGILDDTHLRFYTRESVMRLLSEAGFAAVRFERTTAAVFERSDLVPLVRREEYDPAIVAEVLRDEDAETLQFVVRAAPVAEGQVAAVLSAEITSLQQAVRMLRAQLAQANDVAVAARTEAAASQADREASGAGRLAEVESHYQNALELAELRRAERDEAVAAAERSAADVERLRAENAEQGAAAAARAHAELEHVRAELAERERELARATEHAIAERESYLAERESYLAERESYRAELALRDAAVASSSAALDEARANYELALGALEPLRAELARVQALADARAAERDAAACGIAAAEDELARANASMAESEANLRAARALIAQLEHDLDVARADAAALRDERDESDPATGAALQEAAASRRALQRRTDDLESLLAVERTSREHVEEASDRVLAVARDRDARAAESDLRRLLAASAVVDMQLRFAASAQHGVPSPPIPVPVSMPPALVLHAVTVGRRTVTMLPPPQAGRRERLRAGWRRLRQLVPMLLLLSVGSSA